MKSRLVAGIISVIALGAAMPVAGATPAAAGSGFTCNDSSVRMRTVDGTPLRDWISSSARQIGFLNPHTNVVTTQRCVNSKGNVWYWVKKQGRPLEGYAYSGHLRRY